MTFHGTVFGNIIQLDQPAGLKSGEQVEVHLTVIPSDMHQHENAGSQKALRLPPGLGKGIITVISDDDEHLANFPRRPAGVSPLS